MVVDHDKKHLSRTEIQLKDDVKHGTYILRYENGQKMLEGEWDHGIPVGTARTWSTDGQLKQECEFKDGLIKTQRSYLPKKTIFSKLAFWRRK